MFAYILADVGVLDTLLGRQSMTGLRVENFRDCVENSAGTTIVDEDGAGRLTVRVHSETSVSDELIRLLNSSQVSLRGLSTGSGCVSFVVDID